jgi:acetyl/propionyl-CoA carboxylase alpha subunit/acetyl-CoA carboxylase carboxyltransferase component
MNASFRRVAVVNRGEPAMRFIRAAREYNRIHGSNLKTIVFYTSPDRRSRFVREADEAFDLGEPEISGALPGRGPYTDLVRLRRALVATRADAAWVGWGFVAESPLFAEVCEELGVAIIGASSHSLRLLGDKAHAKLLAAGLGIPVTPWGGRSADRVEEALAQSLVLGFPVLLKAAAGEGGRGIHRIDSPEQLVESFDRLREEALRGFGDERVFIEKWVPDARHIEVQVLADQHGSIWTLGTRDCSIQRRYQKILEEAPAAILNQAQVPPLNEAALTLLRACQFSSAGTVEFLMNPETGDLYFMEVNARLQVEHAVTELTAGIDLVQLQIHVARGGRLEGLPPDLHGHAIEVRLNAEDPVHGFAAAPGSIELLKIPTAPGLRLDSGFFEGDWIPSEFDSMFAKLIAHGRTREEALAVLTRALEESAIVIRGGGTNRAFLLDLVRRPEVRQNNLSVDWLNTVTAHGRYISSEHADIALLQAAVDVYETLFAQEREQFFASAARMRPVVRTEPGHVIELRYQGRFYSFQVYRRSQQSYRIDVSGRRLEVEVDRIGRFERWLRLGERRFRVVSISHGLSHWVEVNGSVHTISRGDASLICALAPAVVASVQVERGATVAAGERLMVLEAMKMEMPVVAPFAGTVREVLVLSNAQVGAGTPLLHLDPKSETGAEHAGSLVDFLQTQADATMDRRGRLERVFTEARQLILGADVDSGETQRLLGDFNMLWQTVPPDDGRLLSEEDRILSIFADISSLFRRQAQPEDPEDTERLSTTEYLLNYLRNLDGRAEGMPPSFVGKLRKALLHYGSESLEPTPELKGRLLWIYLSHQQVDRQAPIISAILERRLNHAGVLLSRCTQQFLAALDRLSALFENSQPTLAELAREAHYRFAEQPTFEEARRKAIAEVEGHLTHLNSVPDAVDRPARVQQIVECPQPIAELLLARRHAGVGGEMQRVVLESLVRRYYRFRSLGEPNFVEQDGMTVCSISVSGEGPAGNVVAVLTDWNRIERALDLACRLPLPIAEGGRFIELYVRGMECTADRETLAGMITVRLNRANVPEDVARVVVAAASTLDGPACVSSMLLSLQPSPNGLIEERTYRDLHPMIAERLQLWRLENFNIARLPSPPDVFLFHCVARENPKDQRLFAVAEVRDLTPVLDASGQVVQLPHLERMLLEALSAIRREQMRRPPEQRLHWNRVLLHVWPTASAEEALRLQELARRLARHSEGLGLEKVSIRLTVREKAGVESDSVLSISNPSGRGIVVRFAPPSSAPLRPLTEYTQKVVRLRQRGIPYPYEIVRSLAPGADAGPGELPPGEFREYDLDTEARLVETERAPGLNRANIVVGVITTFTAKYPEGMKRVILLGDPSKEMGSLAEPECRRIIGAMDLADRLGVPLEWFALSAGAKISMESGTENMDWISRVLRRIVEFTQAGHEINVIVTGINVGAQPYWNAEATMLMHTRGILVMVPESAMVLTGKTALDYSGSVSADDNFGIGGYEHVMGPNGQAQYWAPDLTAACRILLRYYDHTYVASGERFPRRAQTLDPRDRDVRAFPHGPMEGSDFATVGDVFSDERNPGRKRPFDIRKIMLSVADTDQELLERWAGMQDAEVAVVCDGHVGGYPVCMLGFESRPLRRVGFVATDGPEQWTSGTLFPMSSKKIARAINAASNNRPLVILANLSGFDGSPESMRRRQLEFGAEIGRAIVNFRGPIVFSVVSRYHGGAFVVFSRTLNDNMEAVALEGTFASVIGGAPAAAVVFAREVDGRTRKDPRIVSLEAGIAAADDATRRKLRATLGALRETVRSEKLGEVAEEFDRIHSVHRALNVGSLDRIIPPQQLRPYIIEAVERGIARELNRNVR